ncbi:MAG: hypothetical protein AAGK32_11220 [Actinomycetota bacterium]
MTPPTSSLGPVFGRGIAWILLATLPLTFTACGGDSSDLTTHEMLEKLEGRPMTEAEVAERVALADLLCGFENRVLVQVWDRLDFEELEFQDWVFGHHCPDRLTLYTQARPNVGSAPAPTSTADPDDEDPTDDDPAVEGRPIDPEVLDGIERTPATYPEIN